MSKYKIILTTTDSTETVNTISDNILNAQLSPCIQTLKGIESKYIWKGKIRTDSEFLVLIKSLDAHSNEICELIERHHNYDTPEIIKLDFDILSKKYQNWFLNEIKHEN